MDGNFLAIGRVISDSNNLSFLQIEGDHHSIRPGCIATERGVLHEIKHLPWRLGNPGMEASMRVRDRDVWRELIMDKPEAILAVPQRKCLLTKRTTDACDSRLYGSVFAVIPCRLHRATVGEACHSEPAFGFAVAVALASADHEGVVCSEEVGEYDYSKLSRQF